MKIWTLISTILFLGASYAGPIGPNGERLIPTDLKETCTAKADAAMFTYRYRDTFSQEIMFKYMERDWRETWSKIPNIKYATYVDMQRIIRDAYRTDSSGKFIRSCCTNDIEEEQGIKEYASCIYQTEY